jgi:hypothetical protein
MRLGCQRQGVCRNEALTRLKSNDPILNVRFLWLTCFLHLRYNRVILHHPDMASESRFEQ